MELNKAIFIDLDDTLIETNTGRQFPIHTKDWKFIVPTANAIKYYSKQGYKIIIVTNQECIEQGYLSETAFIGKIEAICNVLEKRYNIKPASICYTYCKEVDSYNRIPNPGMVFEMAIEYDIDMINSILIGNSNDTTQLQLGSGIGTYLSLDEIKQIDWNNK